MTLNPITKQELDQFLLKHRCKRAFYYAFSKLTNHSLAYYLCWYASRPHSFFRGIFLWEAAKALDGKWVKDADFWMNLSRKWEKAAKNRPI